MPDGFRGRPTRRYLTDVENTINNASAAHIRNPFEGMVFSSVSPPPLPHRTNQRVPESSAFADSGSFVTSVSTIANIVVSDSIYDELMQKINLVDESVCEMLYNTSYEVEEMCQSVYIVPRTLPRFLRILRDIKQSLGEFRLLTGAVEASARSFVTDINGIG